MIVTYFKIYYILLIINSIINKNLASENNPKLQLKNYEELNYNDFNFEQINHSRRKRQDDQSVTDLVLETNRLSFNAYNRTFNIFLKRNTNLVADNVNIEVRYSYPGSKSYSEYESNHFKKNYFIGFVEDEVESSVLCYFETPSNLTHKPVIYVQIRIYHKENKTTEYFYIEPMLENNATTYIIYRSDDIDSDVISNGVFNSSVCHPKYIKNTIFDNDFQSDHLKQHIKRQAVNQKSKKKKNRCPLVLVADHRFFKEVGNSNTKQTSAYLVNVIGAVNNIYTRTSWIFEDDVPLEDRQNFGFSVEKIIIHATENVEVSDHYNNANSSTNADTILQLFGQNEDWTSFCLAHLFTFQTFDNNVLGLAYVASPLTYSAGGVCSSSYGSKMKKFSVNTGLSSYKSTNLFQKRLTQREGELVTAHEFGHNWGSEHDPLNPECTPSSGINGGNYIMYTYLNGGHDRNNYYFSQCSINSISEVLKSKTHCFAHEVSKFCGNDRIEEDEECDAGGATIQGTDKCCDSKCKLRENAQCSDNNHDCCTNCQIARQGKKCFSNPNYLECFEDHSFCDGLNKECPTQSPKRVGTECKSFDNGKCDSTGHCLSICQQQDLKFASCLCSKHNEKCMICCRSSLQNTTDECQPFHKIFSEKDPRYMSSGRACFDGLCEKNICAHKVKDYVSRFWKVIQTVTVSGFVDFMKRNIVGSIILISLIIWVPVSCCIHFCVDKGQRAEQLQKLKSRISEIKERQSNNQNESIRLNTDDLE